MEYLQIFVLVFLYKYTEKVDYFRMSYKYCILTDIAPHSFSLKCCMH